MKKYGAAVVGGSGIPRCSGSLHIEHSSLQQCVAHESDRRRFLLAIDFFLVTLWHWSLD